MKLTYKFSFPNSYPVKNVVKMRDSNMKSDTESGALMVVRSSGNIFDYNTPWKLMNALKLVGVKNIIFDI